MDVTKRTTIQAGLDPSNFEAGAQKIAATMTQSAQAIQRALLGSSAAFDAMKNKLIEGQKEAMAFATAYMTIMRAVADGRDKLGQSAGMVETLVKQFNLVGPAANAAKQAVTGMFDAAANVGSRLKSTQDLLTIFQGRDDPAPGIKKVGTNLSELTNSTGQSQFAMRQLGVQAIQTFQGFATGQPILMTLIQQGHQVADVMIASGTSFEKLGQAIAGTLRAIPGWVLFASALGAVVVALALITINAEKAAEQTRQLQNQVNAARPGQGTQGAAQAEQAARDLAVTTELGRQEALTAASTVVTNRYWAGTIKQLEDVIVVANNMRRSLGTDLQTEIKKLGDAMQDPGKAAEEASRQFGVFTADIVKHIQDLQAEGKRTEAFDLFFQTMNLGTQAAKDNVTELEKAWRHFNELATGDASKSAWRALGESIAGVLAQLLEGINAVIEKMRELNTPEDWSNVPFTRMWFEKAVSQQRIWPSASGPPQMTAAMDQWRNAPGAVMSGLSTAGAIGTMQLMPGTASGLGVNPFIPSENVLGGMKYIEQLSKQMAGYSGGVEEGIARAYLTGPQGNVGGAAASTYAGKVYHADSSKLPSDTAQMIEYWGSVMQLPPNLIALGKRIAMVESGGSQLPSTAPFKLGPDFGPPLPPGGIPGAPAAGPAGTTDADALRRQQQASQATLAARQAENARQQSAQQAAIVQQTALLSQAETMGDEPEIKRRTQALTELQQHMTELRSEQNRLISDQQKLAQSADDATHPLTAQAGAERALAEVREQFRQTARDTNAGIVDETALSVALTAKQRELTQQRHDDIAALDLQSNAQNAQIALIEKGGRAAEHAANFEKANIDARKTAVPGTKEFQTAVDELTAAYDRNTDSVKRNAAAALSIQDSNRQLELLNAEAAAIDKTTAARERELAMIRERQGRGLAPGDVANAEEQRAIDTKGNVAAKKVENDELKASYNELANSISQSFDTIGSAMADAFLSGKDAAVSFQTVMKTVVQQIIQEVIKLSIINPILNSLFPGSGTRPTLDSVGNALSSSGSGLGSFFSGIFGGGTSAAVSAAANVNMSTSAFFGPGFAHGGVFSGLPGMGNLPGIGNFSNMIVNQPTLFRAYAQGGVMGEAGPEAVMPLVRGPNGALGVRGSGGGTAVIINTPITIQGNATGAGGKLDPQALAALQKQIEGAVKDAARRTIVDEKRPGGDLFGG